MNTIQKTALDRWLLQNKAYLDTETYEEGYTKAGTYQVVAVERNGEVTYMLDVRKNGTVIVTGTTV